MTDLGPQFSFINCHWGSIFFFQCIWQWDINLFPKRAMKTGRIISGWCLANNSLELGKKVSSRRHHHTLFFHAYYSNDDSRAADFLEMSVQFRASGMTCMIRSLSGLTGYESPGNTLRVDHSCSDKDVLFPRFLRMFPEDFRKSIWFMYQAGKCSVTSGPLHLHLLIMCPGWDYASLGSTFVQAGFLWALQPVAMSFMCITVHYSP